MLDTSCSKIAYILVVDFLTQLRDGAFLMYVEMPALSPPEKQYCERLLVASRSECCGNCVLIV